MTNNIKQRVTAFVDPVLVKRAKVRGALEGLTISEVVEKALEEYAPKLETDSNKQIHLKFSKSLVLETRVTKDNSDTNRKVPKHTKALVVPRSY